MELNERTDILLKTIIYCLKASNNKKAVQYLDKYLNLCEKHGDSKSLEKVLEALKPYLEGKKQLKTTKEMFISFHLVITKMYYLIDDYDKAFEIINLVSDVISQLEDNRVTAFFKNASSAVYAKIGRTTKSIELCNEALKLLEDDKTERALAMKTSIHNNLGSYNFRLANYKSSLSFYMKVLKSRTQKQDDDQALVLYNIGRCFLELNDPDRALSYYNDAFGIYSELRNIKGKAKILNSQGLCYFNFGEFEESSKYHHRALESFLTGKSCFSWGIKSKGSLSHLKLAFLVLHQ